MAKAEQKLVVAQALEYVKYSSTVKFVTPDEFQKLIQILNNYYNKQEDGKQFKVH